MRSRANRNRAEKPFVGSALGGTRLSGPLYNNWDHPFRFVGHDKRAPPLEGPACRVRELPFDNPFHFVGHDKRAAPREGLGCQSRYGQETCPQTRRRHARASAEKLKDVNRHVKIV